MSEVTDEQLVDDLTVLIGLHEERVARGAVHGARDLAESMLTLLSAAGRLIPDDAEVMSHSYVGIMRNGLLFRAEPGEQPQRYERLVISTPWVEVPGE